MRVAAGSTSVLLGLGFGIPGIFGIRHFAMTGDVWTFMGFPTYGGGPFERIGIPTSIPLLVGFLTVCLLEVAVGGMIWTNANGAKVFSLVLLPLESVFWIGFALPLAPAFAIVRTILVLLL